MAKIKVDVDISEYLDEVSDKELIKEMAERGFDVFEGDKCVSNENEKNLSQRMPAEYTIRRNFDRHQLHTHLENITGCGGYVSNEELLEQLKYLLENG
jgi:hypothetical protein